MRALLTLSLVAIGTFCLIQLAQPASCGFDLNELPEEALAAADEDEAIEREASKLPPLFDFNNYKQQFGKKYGSFLEELNRKRLYWSRALRAIASGLSYKLYKSTSYNAINEMSDMSATELDRMANRALEDSLIEQMTDSEAEAGGGGHELADEDDDELPEFFVHEGEDLEEELKKLIEENPNEAGYEELLLMIVQKAENNKRVRNKREAFPESADDTQTFRARDFPLENLIHTKESAMKTHVSPKLTRRVETNNPNYEPVELYSFGLNEQQEDVERVLLEVSDKRPLRKQIKSYLKSLRNKSPVGLIKKRSKKADEVFYDLRDTKCFTPTRRQLECGACYAFAATAIMEWLYCKQTGKLVEFSEQYMIDCGRDRFSGMVSRGCSGGDIFATAKFAHNFGMEMRLNYPYRGADGICPYDDSQDLKKTGYIRMEIGRLVRVNMRNWPEHIKHGPMYVTVSTGLSKDIFEYGGGVDQCNYCIKNEGYHAMVVVGHGRESGEEYWLLRNSFGPTWGVEGYWKLSKRAAEKFVHASVGWMYGTTRDGSGIDFQPHLTNRNDAIKSETTNEKTTADEVSKLVPAETTMTEDDEDGKFVRRLPPDHYSNLNLMRW